MEENYKVEFEQTIKSYKDLNRKDLPLYTKKYDGEWLYRLRLHNGRLKADRLVISPFYELKETLIENVLSEDNRPSNRDEWRMNLHNLMKYFEENE
tara:strand:+ start:1377 stop:1664 length:288 start_codon:yes stop_codon:yes gene_type:complete